MKRTMFLGFCMVVIVVSLLTACGGAQATIGSGGSGGNPPVPAPYTNLINPLAGKADAIDSGQVLFSDNCASCHGAKGKGDGPAGQALNPKAADLTQLNPEEDTDGFLFWRISDGGGFPPFNSAMPAWKDILNDTQRWQLVSYLRSISGK